MYTTKIPMSIWPRRTIHLGILRYLFPGFGPQSGKTIKLVLVTLFRAEKKDMVTVFLVTESQVTKFQWLDHK
jgi:hypothetical protein